jgi:drug/metabolite transporter (DMT)-like permease
VARSAAERTGPDRATLIAFAGIVIFGGINAIAVKQMVLELPPFWSAASRFLAAGLILVGLALVTRRSPPRRRASVLGALAYGTFGFAISFGLVYPALRQVPPGTAMVIIAMTPLFTFLLAVAQRQEVFHLRGFVGALVAAIGVLVVFVDQLSAAVPLVPLLMILLGTIAIAESAVIVKWTPRSDPFWTNALAMLAAGVLLLMVSLIAGEAFALPSTVPAWAAFGHLVVLGSVAMFTLYVFGIQRWTASGMSYTTLLMPMVTIVLAAVLFGDSISPLFVLGGAVVLAGVYVGVFTRSGPRRLTATAAPECLPIDNCGEELQPQQA